MRRAHCSCNGRGIAAVEPSGAAPAGATWAISHLATRAAAVALAKARGSAHNECVPRHWNLWGRDLRQFLYRHPLRILAGRLHPGMFLAASRLIAPIYAATAFRLQSLARPNMAKALGLDPDGPQARALCRRFLENNARARMLDLVLGKIEKLGRIECSSLAGKEHLDAALKLGKGVMTASGHFFGNRPAKRYLARAGYPILSIRNLNPADPYEPQRPARGSRLDRDEILRRAIVDQVFIQDPDCVLKIFARLRSGGLVDVHFDTLWTSAGRFLPFLGTRRVFPTGFLKIAFHAGCPVVPMVCLLDRRGTKIIFAEPLCRNQGRNAEEFAAHNLPTLAAVLERQILSHPDQWAGWTLMGLADDREERRGGSGT